jgi:hypothetical protein
MKIDRSYRKSVHPLPLLDLQGDMPAPALLNVDTLTGDVFVTVLPQSGGLPQEAYDGTLKVFPISPALTVRGIDQVFEHPGVLKALRGVLAGDKEAEHYLLEISTSDLYERFDSYTIADPLDYYGDKSAMDLMGPSEGTEAAAQRLYREALGERVYMDPFQIEMHLMDLEDELIC